MIRRLAVGLAMLIMATISGHAHGQFGMTLDESEQFCQSIHSSLLTNLAAQPDPAVAEQLLRSAQAQANRLEGFLVEVEASIGQLMAEEDGPNMELVGFLEQQAVSIEQAIDQAERILDCWGRILDITLARQPGQPLPGTGSIVEAARPYRGEFEAVDALMAGQRQRLAVARALLQDAEMLIVDEPTPDVMAVGPIFYGRLEGGFELPTSDPAIGDTQTIDLGTGGGLAGEIGVRFPLDGDWSLDVGGRIGWSSVPVDAIINQNGGSSPLDGDDALLSGLFSLRINRHFDNGIDLFGDIGLGIGDRRMDVVQNGAVVFDQSASVFVWEIGGGATIDLCECGVAAGFFARYREADGFDARTAFSTLPIGARQTVTLGATLVIELGH